MIDGSKETPMNFVESLNKQREEILRYRNKQYAADNNFTSNFVDVANIAKSLNIKVEPEEVAMILAILKLVRNANAKADGQLLVERLDHLIDFHNYVDLAIICEKYKEGETNEKGMKDKNK